MTDAINKRKARSTSSSPGPAAKRRIIDDESQPIHNPSPSRAASLPQVESQEDSSEEDDEDDEEDEEDEDGGDDDEGLDELDDQESQQAMSEYDDEDEDEYDHSREREVDYSTHLIDEKTVNIKCCTFEGSDVFVEWLDTIVVVCSIDEKEIGRGLARYIKRDRIRSEFWERMEEPCQEMSMLAFEIFNRYGCLRPEFKDHPIRKGSGAWGSELDIGNILFVEEVEVDREWRRKGVGRAIMGHLNRIGQSGGTDRRIDRYNKRYKLDEDDLGFPKLFKPTPYPGRSASFNVLIASWLEVDVEDECEGELQSDQHRIRRAALRTVTAFFRSIGYRRVGHTNCFGLALDQTHPAHKVAISEDFDPVDAPIPEDDDEGDEEEAHVGGRNYNLEKMERLLPIHHAIVTLPDIECVSFLKALAFPPEDDQWSKGDSDLNNVLHIAAKHLKPQSAQWLLGNIDETYKLRLAMNLSGFTPLEAAQEVLEIRRTRLHHGSMTVVMSDHFTGYSEEAMKVLIALKATHSTSTPVSQELTALKFGCTCGECLEGFISPRMSLALKYQAQMHKDTLEEEIEDGEYWFSMFDYLVEHVAPDVRRDFQTDKSLRYGFTSLFNRIAGCLERKEPPTPSNVLEHLRETRDEWPPCTRRFLDRGGKVEDALKVVFEFARDQDEYAGDGEAWEMFKDDFEELRTCRNDHEFEFVALQCGLAQL